MEQEADACDGRSGSHVRFVEGERAFTARCALRPFERVATAVVVFLVGIFDVQHHARLQPILVRRQRSVVGLLDEKHRRRTVLAQHPQAYATIGGNAC